MIEKEICISEADPIKDALKKLNTSGKRVLLVVDNDNRLNGTISDGDIRRYILSGKSLDDSIKDAYNKNSFYIKKSHFSIEAAKKIFLQRTIELIPIVDEYKTVVDYITWDKAFYEDEKRKPAKGKIDVPLVIMAGGKGERLDPFTKIFPKALIPIGDKPIIEIIIDEFRQYSVNNIYLTLNHKAEMIESYFNNLEKDYKVNFVREKDYLGTIGSLKLLEKIIGDIFIVSNCDVIVKANFKEVIRHHKEKKALLTVVSSIQYHKIPYGVIKFKNGGEVIDIEEKPEYTFTINAGVYVMNKEVLDFVPDGSCFHMNELIGALIKNNKKVITYPVNENDYIDIGQWDVYHKAVERIQFGR